MKYEISECMRTNDEDEQHPACIGVSI